VTTQNASAPLDGISVALFLTGPRLAPVGFNPIPSGSSHSASSATGIGSRSPRRPLGCMGFLAAFQGAHYATSHRLHPVSTAKQGRSGLGIEAQQEALQRFADAEGYR